MWRREKSVRIYAAVMTLVLVLGLSPTLFNMVVDPYDRDSWFDLGIDKVVISEKAHYPLWKIYRYQANDAALVVLGDSRARSLRDKYWHEAGREDAFNFAYGGANIREIYDTFNYVKTNPNLKTLIVGIQLRSFDLDHKAGLDRVPEAIELRSSAFSYYTSWFVAKISFRNFVTHFDIDTDAWTAWTPSLITPAMAVTVEEDERFTLLDLLSPEACFGCDLPEPQQAAFVIGPGINLGLGRGLGEWARIWPDIDISRDLPEKFSRQIERNARSDWRSFNFSEELWAMVVEMAEWCKQNDVELVFVIPPTIPEMQGKISEYGYGILNHDFRLRLAELATVVDFDFDGELTRDLANFSDAYHPNSVVSRQIVGELVLLTTDNADVATKALRRRKGLICPIVLADRMDHLSDGIVDMEEGAGCRIWRREGV